MPSPSNVLDCLKAKPERAVQLIRELDLAITEFHASFPYKVSFQDNKERQERTYYAHFTGNVSVELAAIIGNILHDLRSSLDHLAHHLVCLGKGSQGPFTHVYFPIFESAQKYQDGKAKKTDGMRPAAIRAIDALEPFYGGQGRVLWDLHALNIIDKHRLLIPVWGTLTAHTLPRSRREHFQKILRATYPAGVPHNLMHVAGGPVFLKDGGPMLTLPIAELQDTMQFHIQIAFSERIVRGKPVVPTLENMARVVLEIIDEFDAKGLL